MPAEKETFYCLVFSPDGQTLASCGRGPVCLWETGTGAMIRKFQKSDKDGANCVAFSPDGRRLAVATTASVDVWDVYTGEELSARDGKPLLAGEHKGNVLSVAFSPDGKTIASGSADTTILLWNAADLMPKTPVAALDPKELDRLWNDLRSDAPTAYKALAALLGAPKEAAAFLKNHVLPTQNPNVERIKLLLNRLDANDFQTREAAERELAKLDEGAEAALRDTLAGKPSAEMRSRSQRLLAAIEKDEPYADGLRALRAVQVFEQIGSPDARTVLKGLADGSPGRLSRVAKLALGVLDRHIPK